MAQHSRILVVDDEESIREILAAALCTLDPDCSTAGRAENALELLREENFDLVISDIKMPGMDGMDFLRQLKEEQPGVAVCMITAHGSYELAKQALRLGADDFLDKPFDPIQMRETATRLIEMRQNHPEGLHGAEQIETADGIIGDSVAFCKSLSRVQKASRSDSSVLLLGESGTGKEVMARAVHSLSSRHNGPFIPVNCGAIPENLMESELFGYEKGAFTGAISAKPGRVELAQRGTLFLDEVGELPLPLQVKFLRVLQEHELERVGSTTSKKVDFRLVAATNRNLEEAVREGRFREDLYYRLNVIPVELPPLRTREEDIILLAEHFLNQCNQRYGNSFSFSETDRNALLRYRWPGNIRELQNRIERAVVLEEDGKLNLDLPSEQRHESGGDVREARRFAEKETILAALKSNEWNKTRTATVLGISRRSLLYKVKEYQIRKPVAA